MMPNAQLNPITVSWRLWIKSGIPWGKLSARGQTVHWFPKVVLWRNVVSPGRPYAIGSNGEAQQVTLLVPLHLDVAVAGVFPTLDIPKYKNGLILSVYWNSYFEDQSSYPVKNHFVFYPNVEICRLLWKQFFMWHRSFSRLISSYPCNGIIAH